MRLYSLFLILLVASCSSQPESEPTDPTANMEQTLLEPGDLSDEIAEPIEPEKTEEMVEGETYSEDYTSTEYEDIDWIEYEESMTQDFSFVILISTKSYDSALERAKDASEKLGYPLDLRGLHPNDEMGLSLPEEVCEAICGGDVVEYPQYLPRNDWGDTKYVSVEYSDGFDGFTPGYYIVVVASGEKGDPIIQEALEESREFYEDAYAKTCGVYMGCGC